METSTLILPNDLEAEARKRDLARAMQRRAKLKEDNGLLFYRPHAKQDLFHRAGEIRMRFARTGNRFGKSTMGVAEDCSWALGERLWYDKSDPARTLGLPHYHTKGVIICSDWDKAEEIFTDEQNGKLRKLLPKDKVIKWENNQSGNCDKVRVESVYGGVSTICLDTVKSFLSNAMGHESSDWDWIHIDEPCPQEMFEAYARGLIDRQGSAWFTCTPLTEFWINDMFFPAGQMRADLSKPYMKPGVSRWVMTGSIYDNPTLSAEAIKDFEGIVSARTRATRLFGKPLQLAGAIYDEFDESVHVYQDTPKGWPAYHIPPSNWTIRYAIDIHDAFPQAVLFAATGPLGHTYFFAENFDEIHIGRAADRIKETLGSFVPFSVIADPRAWIENPRDGTTIADDFHKAGIFCEPGPKDLQRGILTVKEMLKARDRNGNPILNFSNHLTETLREFERYVYDQKTGRPNAKAPDHMMENLYRLCINGLEYIEPGKQDAFIKPVAVTKTLLDLPKMQRLDADGVSIKTRMSFKNRYGRRD